MGLCEGKAEYEKAIQQEQILSPIKQQTSLTDEEKFQLHGPPSSIAIKITNPPNFLNELTQSVYSQCGDYNARSQNDQNINYYFGPMQFVNDQSVYFGEWKNKKRNGVGKIYYKDGSFYQGEWKNDAANGKGRLIHPDGDYYEGDWQEDQTNGYGIYVHMDGAKYEGEWVNDKQNGRGCEIWPDGATFEGNYISGKKQGEGSFNWINGNQYIGNFVDGRIEGYGTFKWSNGQIYVGDWKNNAMDGFSNIIYYCYLRNGSLKYPDGSEYKGQFIKDKRHGKGEFTSIDGKSYNGQWVNNKQHGKGKLFDQGNVYETEWENGQCISQQQQK